MIYCIFALTDVSIHASSREDATSAISPVILRNRCFNPRVLAGGRDAPRLQEKSSTEFQSTRPRGRTRHIMDAPRLEEEVSIHASSREDATQRFRFSPPY